MRKLFLTVSISALLIITSNNAFSCSAFLMKGDNYCVIGFNENWKSMPGMVVINKRGIVKKNISWNYLTSENKPNEPELEWTSKYGSVSFNLLGLDLPCYGVNEKGLFIVELFLNKTFSAPDSLKPKMFWGQWIQYQLDNYSSVSELIQNLKNAPVIDWWPTFPGSHFFISDKEGNAAAVELINGVIKVSSGKDMPVQVLCNAPYQNSVKNLQKYKAFGGEGIFNIYSQVWNDRFAKAAHLIKNYSLESKVTPVTYAWNVLDSITPGVWQLVADVKNDILYFRTDQGKDIKRIDISKCDFSKNSSLKFIDIHSEKKGAITHRMNKVSARNNDEYIEKGFPVGYENPEFYNSVMYTNLKRNLHNYTVDKLNQIGNLTDKHAMEKLNHSKR